MSGLLCAVSPPDTPSSPRAAPQAPRSRCGFCFPPVLRRQARGAIRASCGRGDRLDPRGLQASPLGFRTAAFSMWRFQK